MSETANLGSTPAEGFAVRLRKATSAVHTRAEKTVFIRGFLRGTATRSSYTRLLAALYPIYNVMEEETRRCAERDILVRRFCFPELGRTQALERDLCFLAGPRWAKLIPTMPESRAYAERIHAVAESDPVRLVGHLYTRYMGDLSGGQILARIAERSLGLGPGAGLDFYDFGPAVNIPEMKERFRARLDEVGAQSEDAGAAIIDEAGIAFRHNIAIFEALKGNAFMSFFRNLPLPLVRAQRLSAAL